MKFRVRLQPAAAQDLEEAYTYAAQQAPEAALRWLNRFEAALQTLHSNPDRCPSAPESRKSGRDLKEFLFGKRGYVFRVIYTISKDTVWILRICRAQRRPLMPRDLPTDPEQ